MKLLLVISLALVACVSAIPWVAEPRNEQWWLDRHNSYNQNTAINRDNINVLFYGDSITEGWGGEGRSVWDANYAALGSANYGIGGDQTQHLLWRISNGEVDGLHPKLIVLKIGTNNGGDSVNDVVAGIRSVVDLLRQRMPNARILLLGVLPRNDAGWFQRVFEINVQISAFADNQSVFYLDMFNDFIVGWGQVDPALYTGDQLHLVTAGYQKWADVMRPLFNQLMA